MKHVTLTETLETSKGRMCANAVVKLCDAEADALIRLGSAKLYEFTAAQKKSRKAMDRHRKANIAAIRKAAQKAKKAPKPEPAPEPAKE